MPQADRARDNPQKCQNEVGRDSKHAAAIAGKQISALERDFIMSFLALRHSQAIRFEPESLVLAAQAGPRMHKPAFTGIFRMES